MPSATQGSTKGVIDATTVPVDKLLARLKEAKQARIKYDTNWDRNYKLYVGKQWDGVDKLWFQSEPTYNKVFEYVEVNRSMLADNRWGIDAMPCSVPKGADDKRINDMAEKVNKLLDFVWDDSRLQGKLSQAFLQTFLKGTGFIKTVFDPDNVGDSGIGQIETVVVDPYYIYPDPDATCVEDASFIFEAKPVSIRWIQERYPEAAKQLAIKGGGNKLEMAPRGESGTYGAAPMDEGKRIDIYECWYKDSTVEDVAGSETETTKQVQSKYPDGRYTLMTDTGIIFEDKPNPYNGFPYTRFVEIPMPGEFWGGCTIDKVAELQMNINQVVRAIIDNGLWLTHGIWVVDRTSGVSAASLATYGPRDVVSKNPGSEVRRDSGVPLPGHIFQMLQELVEAFDRVAGLPDVLRGIVGSRQPVQTVQMQQESGEVRTRERGRRVEESLAYLGKQILSIVSNNWAEKRSIRRMKAIGGLDVFTLSKKDFEGWDFDLIVRPGSTLPMDRASALTKCIELRNSGIQIPDSYILRLSGLPGIEAAVAEMEAAANEAGDATSVNPDEIGPVGPDGPGDQNPGPEDLAALSPEEQASIEAQGGISQFP